MKKSTPKFGLNSCTAARYLIPENLEDVADGENYEWTDMYAGFAKEAREEVLSRDS